MKNEFGIKDTPTLVFIRDGKPIDRIDNLEESNPDIAHSAEINGETADERRVRQKLNELCKGNH